MAWNALSNYAGTGVAMLVGFLLLPYILDRVGAEQYGLWVVVLGLVGYFPLLELGVGGSVVKTVAEHRARGDREALNALVSAGFVVFLASGAVVAVVTLVAAVWAERFFDAAPASFGSLRVLILVMGVNAALALPLRIFERVLAGYQRFDLVNLAKGAMALVNAALTVVALEAGYGVLGLAVAHAVASVASYGFQGYLVYRIDPRLRLTRRGVTRQRVGSIGELSAALLVVGLAWQAILTVDQLLVGYFLGLGAVAVYTVGRKLRDLILSLVGPLGTVFFPLGAALAAETGAPRALRAAVSGTKVCFGISLLLAVALGVHATPLVTLWVGAEYAAPAVPVLRLLLLGAAASGAAWVVQEMLHAGGGHRLGAALLSGEAVGGALLAVALLPAFGIAGVAAAVSAFSVVSAAAALWSYVRHYLGGSVGAFARRALVPPAVAAALALGGSALLARALPPAGVVALGGHLVATALLFGACFLGLAVSGEDRRALAQAWRGRRRGAGGVDTAPAQDDGRGRRGP